jgi:hypothetical protein
MERHGAKDPEGPPESVGDLPAAIASRVEAIVRAAEMEAAAVMRDLAAQRRAAEAEVQRYLSEARRRGDLLAGERTQQLRELTGELVERAEDITRQLEALLAALKRTTAALETVNFDGEPVSPSPPPPPPAPAAEPAAVGSRDLSAARLVAIEMAVAGRTRDQVAEHLREAFHVDDTGALLDDVFGAVGPGL